MDKFVYAVCDEAKGTNEVKTIYARNFTDAQDRIIKNYWDKYEDLKEDNWNAFLDELCDTHSIIISDVLEIDELNND